jgi:hypothetical protein
MVLADDEGGALLAGGVAVQAEIRSTAAPR